MVKPGNGKLTIPDENKLSNKAIKYNQIIKCGRD
jgi:hypothetical protein